MPLIGVWDTDARIAADACFDLRCKRRWGALPWNPRPARSPEGDPLEIATRRAVMMRDAGLERILAITVWLIAVVVALSGTHALVAAGGFPGHASSGPGAPASSSPSSSPSGLRPPAQARAPAPAAAVVVSGGS